MITYNKISDRRWGVTRDTVFMGELQKGLIDFKWIPPSTIVGEELSSLFLHNISVKLKEGALKN